MSSSSSSSEIHRPGIVLKLREQKSLFHNHTFYEKVDLGKLDTLIKGDILDGNPNAERIKNQLKLYSKNYNKNHRAIAVKYFKSSKHNKLQFGRCFPQNSLGLTMLPKKIRDTLISGLMVDIDLVNAQLEILLNVCQENQIQCPCLQEYCETRDTILASIATQYQVDRSICKTLFITLLYGGTFRSWVTDNDLNPASTPSAFMAGFINEIHDISIVIKNENEALYQQCAQANVDNHNILGSFLSIYLQEFETRIVESMYGFLKNQTNIVDGGFFVTEFDGVKLLKYKVEAFEGECNGLMQKLEKHVEDSLGFVIHLTEKPIEPYYDIVVPVSTFVHDPDLLAIKNGYVDRDVSLYIYKRFFFAPGETNFEKCNQILVSSGSKKNQQWYTFTKTGWVIESDDGAVNDLIVKDFRGYLSNYYDEYDKSVRPDPDIQSNLDELIKKSGKDCFIKPIISGLFYEAKIDSFEEKLDVNPYLLNCNNGVIDLKNKLFRDALPSDLCSLSTKIDYKPEFEFCGDETIIGEIEDFFEKVFPIETERKYIWDFMASCLFGTTTNQSFTYFLGIGSNGKSMHMDLMSKTLGQYTGSIPAIIVTSKRSASGACTPDLVKLKGIRFAVIQEPEDNAAFNAALIKELTGGDPITARGLYKDPVTFKPMFQMVICANERVKIEGTNEGIWRRLKVVNYISRFVHNNPSEEDYIYLLDDHIKFKFDSWKEHLFYKLVQIGFQNQGKVKDSEAIIKATNAYRNSEDKLGQFILEMIIPSDLATARVDKKHLSAEFKAWIDLNYNSCRIAPKKLFERLEKMFTSTSTGFDGFFIKDTENMEKEVFVHPHDDFINKVNETFEITAPEDNNYVTANEFNGWCLQIQTKLNNRVRCKLLNDRLKMVQTNKRINGKVPKVFKNLKKRKLDDISDLHDVVDDDKEITSDDDGDDGDDGDNGDDADVEF